FHEVRYSLVVAHIDDPRVIGVPYKRRIHGSNNAFRRIYELVCPAARQENVVRRDACLSAVVQLAGHDSLCGFTQWVSAVDDDRTFTAQLQSDRNQVLAGSLHDQLPDASRAREK